MFSMTKSKLTGRGEKKMERIGERIIKEYSTNRKAPVRKKTKNGGKT